MESAYSKGVAFIFEGDTEKAFYINLLEHLCQKHEGYILAKQVDIESGEIYFVLESQSSRVLIKMNVVGTISQLTNSGAWFTSKCYAKNKKLNWNVILCYDTDDYKEDFSKFHEGDWEILRKTLSKKKTTRILDMAANADIEDTMLLDSDSVFKFLEMEPCPIPSGSKGKRKMKKLFRLKGQGIAYHEGVRADPLIRALDFDVIIGKSRLPFDELEEICFS
ncbi:MAG: hypothetical protein E7442_02985 [Ruminococcaceae bacterium]|nr:hypothetical protein [Oscillospiraceae bacterium]